MPRATVCGVAVVAVLLAGLLCVVEPAAAAPGLIDLSNVQFFESVTTGLKKGKDEKMTFVLYHTPWSQVCKAMEEDYKEVSRHFHRLKKSHVMIARLNAGDPALEIVARREGIRAFPTLKLYIPGEEPIVYKGDYGHEEMIGFLEKHLKRQPWADKTD